MSRRLAMLLAFAAQAAHAQSGGFVATLGYDTVHVERFTRSGNTLGGVIVTRVPATRIARYKMTLAPNGRPLRYEVTTTDAAGKPVTTNGAAGSLTFNGDSVTRETLEKEAMSSQQLYAPNGVYPTSSIPYVGVSYLMYEQAFAAARQRGDSGIYLVTMFAAQKSPQRSRAWFPAKDSAELDYFGVARSGYRFDDQGNLIRADWRGTTYRYRITRVADADVDVERLARDWSAADARGAGIGALSPRDSSKGVIDGANLAVEYSRPSRRGRNLWGDVVKSDSVWRLGADMATHFTTSADLTIGDAIVPAGRYTLWMLLKASGDAQLIVNKRVNVFGTNYDPRADFARIDLRRSERTTNTEHLTISFPDRALEIAWGTAAWTVPIRKIAEIPGLPATGEPAVMFAPGIVSTGDVFASTFTNDARTVVFTKFAPPMMSLMSSTFSNGSWGAPTTLPFSGTYRDLDPAFSPNGSRLYFSSWRPSSASPADTTNGMDTWYADRTAAGWSTPSRPPEPVNSASLEAFPSITYRGALYFDSNRDSKRLEVYRAAVRADGTLDAPVLLPPAINADSGASNLFVDPDDRYVVFGAARPEGLGALDLYISFRVQAGWSPPKSLGPQVNTTGVEFCPFVSSDGKFLFFTRATPPGVTSVARNIYVVRFDDIRERLKP